MTVLWWMVISSSGGIGRAGKVGGSVMEGLHCMELSVGNDTNSLWVEV